MLASAACDAGTQQYQSTSGPAVKLVEVVATTDLTGVGGGATIPAQSAIGLDGSSKNVLPTTSLVLRFDRFLDPTLAPLRQSICVQGSSKQVDTPDDCTEGRAFISPAYDPVHRTVTLHLTEVLAAQTTFRITLLAPPEKDDQRLYGIRAFDGAPLEATRFVEFTTLDSSPGGDVPEAASTADRYGNLVECLRGFETTADQNACLDACTAGSVKCRKKCCVSPLKDTIGGCAYGTCHLPSAVPTPVFAAEGLNLGSPQYIALTAIGKTAHETQTGEHADDADESGRKFARAMPIIDPGNPGNSYLLYKLIAHPSYRDGPASPGREEYARLRNSIVVGMPMPAAGAPLNIAALDQLTSWIAAGADLSCFNGTKDAGETDVDCGGPKCFGCVSPQLCGVDGDCAGGTCAAGKCLANCNDGATDGTETDVDCGGLICAKCAENEACAANADCAPPLVCDPDSHLCAKKM